MGLSEKLKAGREARGWTIEDVGSQLKLPARVIVRVEAGDFESLGAFIYRRGYLRSFARLVGVPAEDVEASLRAAGEQEPELIATGVKPRGDYVLERFLRPASYIALTALIALPVVWWTASGRLGQELAGRGSFDLQPPPLSAAGSLALANAEPVRPEPLPIAEPQQQTELVRASMMSMPQNVTRDAQDELRVWPPKPDDVAAGDGEPVRADPQVIGSGGNEAVLRLTANSWVEVDAGGKRIQQALLTPGQWRYRSDGVLSFKIGNSSAAVLTAGGKRVDLSGHRSQNDVARVELFAEEG